MSTTTADKSPEEALKEKQGAFAGSLLRNNKQIRYDRGLVLVEKTEKHYRRTIEDLTDQISAIKMEGESMLDLSPTNAQSLTLAADFDEKDFVTKDVDLGVKIRNLGIRRDVAVQRYEYLFGTYKGTTV